MLPVPTLTLREGHQDPQKRDDRGLRLKRLMANCFLIQFTPLWVSIVCNYFLLVLHVTPVSSLCVRDRLFSLFEVCIDLKDGIIIW